MIVDLDPDPDSKRFREFIEQAASGTYMLTNSRQDRFEITEYHHTNEIATLVRIDSTVTNRLTYGFISNQMKFAHYVDPKQKTLYQWDSSYMQL